MTDDFDAVEIQFQCGDYTSMRVWCDLMAVTPGGVLQATSVAGPHTAVQAFGAERQLRRLACRRVNTL